MLLTERDDRLYGLGATDMKGFFPLALEAARTFRDQPLKQPLIVLATADEEGLVRVGPLATGADKLSEACNNRMLADSGHKPGHADDLSLVLFRPGPAAAGRDQPR